MCEFVHGRLHLRGGRRRDERNRRVVPVKDLSGDIQVMTSCHSAQPDAPGVALQTLGCLVLNAEADSKAVNGTPFVNGLGCLVSQQG